MRFFKGLFLFVTVISYPVFAQDKVVTQGNDVLYDVLALAYENNPTIRASRAEFLAVQEQVAQARSGFLPTVTANADITHSDTEAKGSSFVVSDGKNTSKSASLDLNQPLYRGGSTRANVKQAHNIVTAQKFALSATEQEVIYNAVEVYMDLYRDRAVLDLQENNKSLVAKELEQAQARFHVGEITRTDVSQSEARLAEAKAGIIKANAAVKTSMARFQQIVGAPPPAGMGYPAIKFEMPKTLAESIDLAQSNNRDILQARFNKQAAGSLVSSIRGELLPQVSAIGRLDKVYDQSDFIEEQRQAVIGLSASIPLYTGGLTHSRVREAKKVAMQRAEQVHVTRESVRQEVVSYWENWHAAKAETQARQAQVKASSIAQEGVQYEAEFGERTTLDALDSHQELLSAQVELIKTKRNEIVARFALAESLGLLVPQNLGFSRRAI